MDIVKFIVLGVFVMGMVGYFLFILMKSGLEVVVEEIVELYEELMFIMVVLGVIFIVKF